MNHTQALEAMLGLHEMRKWHAVERELARLLRDAYEIMSNATGKEYVLRSISASARYRNWQTTTRKLLPNKQNPSLPRPTVLMATKYFQHTNGVLTAGNGPSVLLFAVTGDADVSGMIRGTQLLIQARASRLGFWERVVRDSLEHAGIPVSERTHVSPQEVAYKITFTPVP